MQKIFLSTNNDDDDNSILLQEDIKLNSFLISFIYFCFPTINYLLKVKFYEISLRYVLYP